MNPRDIPANPDLERVLLGSVILDGRVMHEVAQVVSPADFFRPDHQAIYRTILDRYRAGGAIDCPAIDDALRRSNASEAVLESFDVVLDAVSKLPHTLDAEPHARTIRDLALKRELIDGLQNALKVASDRTASLESCLGAASKTIHDVIDGAYRQSRCHGSDASLEAMERISKRREGEHAGIETGLFDFDELSNGLYPKTLTILAGRPSMGKTALGLQVAEYAARSGRGVLFLSLEMDRVELGERLLVSASRVSGHRVRSECQSLSNAEYSRLGDAYNEMGALERLIIDDVAHRTPSQIGAIVRQERARRNIELVVIDYLQLIDATSEMPPRASRQEAVAHTSRRLRAIAKETNVAVLALAQLNRMAEQRGDHRPQLADLRESGQIEQDADLVLFVHRPEYYDPQDSPGVAELLVRKNRNGRTGIIPLTFIKDLARFDNHSPMSECEEPF